MISQILTTGCVHIGLPDGENVKIIYPATSSAKTLGTGRHCSASSQDCAASSPSRQPSAFPIDVERPNSEIFGPVNFSLNIKLHALPSFPPAQCLHDWNLYIKTPTNLSTPLWHNAARRPWPPDDACKVYGGRKVTSGTINWYSQDTGIQRDCSEHHKVTLPLRFFMNVFSSSFTPVIAYVTSNEPFDSTGVMREMTIWLPSLAAQMWAQAAEDREKSIVSPHEGMSATGVDQSTESTEKAQAPGSSSLIFTKP
ncbi:uncharacterized protein LACBIDRAFT_329934 [Laccaria bicolor S238N-H82]|uniref:Predicted protein n=1 Tax=Laccaria bicolor (strain S238N-H82 / ATCC MYA-4686) TaxID=486041 RepID=B0DJM8_LACBS|nr:uncharacterized protein LACBIDRAFT_329934 [Laccaria bicolor S238N-H82]EDR05236.1 predicted protein [Laccaria bicolor S238N-H82]|eukprot:XP_001884201.1 predicted protein [Laccaria bicolor S238N-H82]